MDNAVKREVINKKTGEVYKVVAHIFGEQELTVTTIEVGNITFANKDRLGDLQNDEWDIREVA